MAAVAGVLPLAAFAGTVAAGSSTVNVTLTASPARALIGTQVTLVATASGSVPRSAQPLHLVMFARSGSGGWTEIHRCPNQSQARLNPCPWSVRRDTHGTVEFVAGLYDRDLHQLGSLSGVDTVEWYVGEATLLTISVDGATSSTYVTDDNGHTRGDTTCSAMVQGGCHVEKVVPTRVTLTARLNGVLPSGFTELWLIYSPPESAANGDPDWRRCDPSIKSNCVIARTTAGENGSENVQVTETVDLPPKSAYGGSHASSATAQIVNGQGYVAADMGISFCQKGFTPVCG